MLGVNVTIPNDFFRDLPRSDPCHDPAEFATKYWASWNQLTSQIQPTDSSPAFIFCGSLDILNWRTANSTSEFNDLSYPISHHDATNQAKWTYTDTYPFQIIFSKSNFTSNHGTTCLHLKDSHGCRDRKPMTSPGMPWPARFLPSATWGISLRGGDGPLIVLKHRQALQRGGGNDDGCCPLWFVVCGCLGCWWWWLLG